MIDKKIREKFNYKRERDNLPYNVHHNRNTLAELLGELGFNTGAEIGTQRGKFSEILCKANPNLQLFCIDPWAAYHMASQERQDEIYQEAVERLEHYNVRILRMYSLDALSEVQDNSLDFVYIDGDHMFNFVCPDIIFWSGKVKTGGIVAVHDYYQFGMSGVVEAVNSYTKCNCIKDWYVTKEREPTAFWVKP